jgi:hypothetical protein
MNEITTDKKKLIQMYESIESEVISFSIVTQSINLYQTLPSVFFSLGIRFFSVSFS